MIIRPTAYAIAMWDFSWLERRWSGAGYEDWDRALDELAERGYDAVRIDAYPHLVAAGGEQIWRVHSCAQHGTWGAPAPVEIRVLPALLEFIAKCRDRRIAVGLSTWYKEDDSHARDAIRTPQDQAEQWLLTLRHIERAGLLDAILFLDLCNEFPWPKWAPFLYLEGEAEKPLDSPEVGAWMNRAIAGVKAEFPALPCCFSFYSQSDRWAHADVSSFDLLEPHIWMAASGTSDWAKRIGYSSASDSFQAVVERGRSEYEARRDEYDGRLARLIDAAAQWSRACGLPVVTTECWALIHYKDWPGLDWEWIKDICAQGLERAADTGRWSALATSNFCGPQFVGMWRDVRWHRRMSDRIKRSKLAPDLLSGMMSR